MLEREQIDFFLINACNAALAGGRSLMEAYSNPDLGITLKADNTPVTHAEALSHNTIKQQLSKTRVPLMSEEGRHILFEERYMWDLYWLVDPLDGTMEFISRNGEFTINIALMYNNTPLFGVIYVPQQQALFFSDPDRGAFKIQNIEQQAEELRINHLFSQGTRLTMTEADLNHTCVALTRSHLSEETLKYVETLKLRFGELTVKHYGSALKFCLLSDNQIDFFIRQNKADDWDTAAGEAIVKAAGGKVLHLNNQPLVYNKEHLNIDEFYAAKPNITL